MKVNSAACDRSRVARFVDQELTAEEQLTLEQHLETCATCRDQLNAETAEPSWWREARIHLHDEPSDLRPLASAEVPSGPISTPQSDLHEAASSNIDRVLELLARTDDPQMLGRLGPYEVMGVVGSGGMGVVLKGLDTALNRYVAI